MTLDEADMHANPRGRDDVVFRSVSGDWVLYDPNTKDLHVLNSTAAAVWACCDGSLTVEGIAAEVGKHLEGAPDVGSVLEDVQKVLQRFRESGLLG